MNIVLMGNGAWGSAIGTLLKENKLDYKIWQENQKIEATPYRL